MGGERRNKESDMANFKIGAVKGKYAKGNYIGEWGAGYYWSHINQTGFDWFLRYMLNCTRERFTSRSKLKKGQIIIGNSSGHTYAIVDSKTQAIAEANDAWKDSICYGREYINYDPYWVYTLPWTEEEIDAFLYNLKAIANDNSYYYSHNNSLGDYDYYNAKGLDCCTYISLALYITLGWKWNNQRYQNANYQYIYYPAVVKKNGLQNEPEPDGRYAYYTDGKIDTSVTTVAQNAYGWWYVKNGYVDFTYYGLASNDNGWWVIQGGKVNFDAKKGFYEGTVKGTYGFWWCDGGKVQFNLDDIVKDPYDNNWRYVKGGRFIDTFNSISANSNGVWRLVDGVVDFTDGAYDVKVTVKGGRVMITPAQQ